MYIYIYMCVCIYIYIYYYSLQNLARHLCSGGESEVLGVAGVREVARLGAKGLVKVCYIISYHIILDYSIL